MQTEKRITQFMIIKEVAEVNSVKTGGGGIDASLSPEF
jgi:hypothetical protein